MREPIPETFTLYKRLPVADIFHDSSSATAVILTKLNFIAMEAFQSLFAEVATLLDEAVIQRIIFDKRSLTVFHQPSMEWYYLDWKPRMFQKHSLKRHDKILPKDELFRESVDRARNQIYLSNPEHIIQQIQPVYFENLQEALTE